MDHPSLGHFRTRPCPSPNGHTRIRSHNRYRDEITISAGHRRFQSHNRYRNEIAAPDSPPPGSPPGDLAFHYADVFANWYDHWPPRPDAKPLAEPGRAAAASEPQSVDDVVAALALDALANAAAPASDDPLADPAMD